MTGKNQHALCCYRPMLLEDLAPKRSGGSSSVPTEGRPSSTGGPRSRDARGRAVYSQSGRRVTHTSRPDFREGPVPPCLTMLSAMVPVSHALVHSVVKCLMAEHEHHVPLHE